MDNTLAKKVWESVNQLVGATISADNDAECRQLVSESLEKATQHEWLYHCTTTDGLLNILKSNEFWLTNLKNVNDKEEAERIDIPNYEKSYYVSCFSYDSNIPYDHWKEYGTLENGIVIGVKKEWFVCEPIFMTTAHQKCIDSRLHIYKSWDEALDYQTSMAVKGIKGVDPYHVFDYGFYQIIYDDELKKKMLGSATIDIHGEKLPINSISPQIPGIIKSRTGWCQRSGYEKYRKNWESEKEVRLKVGIHRMSQSMGTQSSNCPDIYCRQVAIPLIINSFDTIKIAFSPDFSDRDKLLTNLRSTYPQRRIEILN